MEQLSKVEGIAAPLLRPNIDTDQIIPAKFLVRSSSDGIGEALFAAWRLLENGRPNPDFILNVEPWTRTVILLTDENFGCGSSREGAPKAIRDWGIRAVLAPSFGGIFYSNCFRNGVLPVVLPISEIREIARQVEVARGNAVVTADLTTQLVTSPRGETYAFQTPPILRQMLLEGLDEIDVTLKRAAEIEQFRSADAHRRPWAYRFPEPAAARSSRTHTSSQMNR